MQVDIKDIRNGDAYCAYLALSNIATDRFTNAPRKEQEHIARRVSNAIPVLGDEMKFI